jgi:polyisoprenoid-binding protein YceI
MANDLPKPHPFSLVAYCRLTGFRKSKKSKAGFVTDNFVNNGGHTMTRWMQMGAAILVIATLTACGPAAAPADAPAAQAEEATSTPAPATEATPAADREATTSEAGGTLPTGNQVFVIVPEESTASYIVDEEFFGLALGKYGIPEGLVDTVGRTQAIEGQFELNWDDLSAPLGENTFTVDLSTLESDQALRDQWIRENGPAFGQYPNATFVAESLANAPASYTPGETVTFQLIGQLTIREVTQPATFDVTATYQDGTVTGTATTTTLMSNFGITPPDFANTLTVADEFQIQIDFTARAQ